MSERYKEHSITNTFIMVDLFTQQHFAHLKAAPLSWHVQSYTVI